MLLQGTTHQHRLGEERGSSLLLLYLWGLLLRSRDRLSNRRPQSRVFLQTNNYLTYWNLRRCTTQTKFMSFLQNIRTDIVMDVGKSINPALDIGQVRSKHTGWDETQTTKVWTRCSQSFSGWRHGKWCVFSVIQFWILCRWFQIEGGFVQGIGLYTIEELEFSSEGVLMTRSPSQYKIPALCDIPPQLNVHLLANAENPYAIYMSKAIWTLYTQSEHTSKENNWQFGNCQIVQLNSLDM